MISKFLEKFPKSEDKICPWPFYVGDNAKNVRKNIFSFFRMF
jgi:hypothetical protein